MQFGIKVANYPLIPEDFDRGTLPEALEPLHSKLFGLSIKPERLSEIRNERRPGSRYASIENCRSEIEAAENLMQTVSNGSIPPPSPLKRSLRPSSRNFTSKKRATRKSLRCRGHSKAPAASSPFRFLINLLALYSLFPIESSENIALNIFQERHHEKPVL